jgi:hypothetical protein
MTQWWTERAVSGRPSDIDAVRPASAAKEPGGPTILITTGVSSSRQQVAGDAAPHRRQCVARPSFAPFGVLFSFPGATTGTWLRVTPGSALTRRLMCSGARSTLSGAAACRPAPFDEYGSQAGRPLSGKYLDHLRKDPGDRARQVTKRARKSLDGSWPADRWRRRPSPGGTGDRLKIERQACSWAQAPQLAYLVGDGARTPATDEMSRCSKPQM